MASIQGASGVVPTREHALALDKADPLRSLRDEFIFPSKQNLKAKSLPRPGQHSLRSI